jgi:hypothetical protein
LVVLKTFQKLAQTILRRYLIPRGMLSRESEATLPALLVL